ncbi:DNA-directed DNA polymerase [Synchytrium endobioticum]|uniref:DNA-directed DNA polymerase n=1 Tax=Synchytrium endobioticum TaxID=286115 RepID=A0A507CUE0_9FUNG|nr:DNA-directed DNA polymerase [Synchytrium endobioticum]
MHEDPYVTSTSQHPLNLEVLAADVIGPFRTPAPDGTSHYLVVQDVGSHYGWVMPLKRRGDATSHLIDLIKMLNNHFSHKVKHLQIDNAPEFTSHRAVERYNRTLQEKARTLLISAALPPSFWSEALQTSVYLENRLTTRSIPEAITPYQKLYNTTPTYDHLRTFGCRVICHDPTQQDKQHPRSIDGIFVGYDPSPFESIRGWRIWDKIRRRIFYSRNVTFLEQDMKNGQNKEDNSQKTPDGISIQLVVPPSIPLLPKLPLGQPDKASEPDMTPEPQHTYFDLFGIQDEYSPEVLSPSIPTQRQPVQPPSRVPLTPTVATTRERRQIRPPHHDSAEGYPALLGELPTPKTYKQAMKAPDANDWINAMAEEVAALKANNTWDLVEYPNHKHVLPGKWVYVTKHNEDGSIARYKARWVVQGNFQIDGMDYDETFAPTSHLPTLRVLVSLIAHNKWYASTLDISTAFLNGKLEEEIYVRQPTGFELGSHQVCRLQKSLYGLKQAPRVWFKHLSSWLQEHGFTSSPAEPCLYTGLSTTTSDRIYVMIHVDDFLLTSSSKQAVKEFENTLEQTFKMKKGGPLSWYLNMQFLQLDPTTIGLSQSLYVKDILDTFSMADCNPTKTPMVTGWDVVTDAPLCNKSQYQQAMGMLLYLARCTRPDIMTSVSILCKYSSNPTTYHWKGVLHLLKYLKGSQNYILELGGTELSGYADSDWATNKEDRKSRSGMIIKMGRGCVSWSSKKQSTIALSSSEAEYYALGDTIKEILWLQNLLEGIQYTVPLPTIIYEDNRGAQLMAENPLVTPRAKHIDVKYHFIRHHVENGRIKLFSIPTVDQIADGLTKPLDGIAFQRCRDALCVTTREGVAISGSVVNA